MTMNTSGQISLGGSAVGQSINLEVGNSPTSQIDMGGSQCRILSQVPSGQIQMPTNFYGKTNQIYINLTISGNTNNYNIKANCPSYIAGMTNVTLTINSGVTVGTPSVGAWALDTGDGWVAGDTINVINNGIIVGGAGARGVGQPPTDGGPGGPAFRVNKGGGKFKLVNAGTIMGGGGGGGGGGGSGHNFYQAKGGAGNTGIGAVVPLDANDIVINTGAIGGGGGGGGCTPSGGDGSGGGGGGGAGYGRPGAPGTNTISAPDNAQGGGLLNGGAGGSSTNWGQSGNGGNAGTAGNAPPGGGGAGGAAGAASGGGFNGASISGGGAIYGTLG